MNPPRGGIPKRVDFSRAALEKVRVQLMDVCEN